MWSGNERDKYSLLAKIKNMSKYELGFVQTVMDNLVKEKENQYVHGHLEEFNEYLNYKILEFYDNGNCLNYLSGID